MNRISYNITIQEHIPASPWGKEIRRVTTYFGVSSDMYRILLNDRKTEKVLKIEVEEFNPWIDSAGN